MKEIKEEMKRFEGDPKIKQRVRSIQMQLARKRMLQNVPDADVIITNDVFTEEALRCRYGPGGKKTPLVKTRLISILWILLILDEKKKN